MSLNLGININSVDTMAQTTLCARREPACPPTRPPSHVTKDIQIASSWSSPTSSPRPLLEDPPTPSASPDPRIGDTTGDCWCLKSPRSDTAGIEGASLWSNSMEPPRDHAPSHNQWELPPPGLPGKFDTDMLFLSY